MTIKEVYTHTNHCKACRMEFKQLTLDGQCVLNVVYEYARIRQLIHDNGIKNDETRVTLAKQFEYTQLAIDVLSKRLGTKELQKCVKIASCVLQSRISAKL